MLLTLLNINFKPVACCVSILLWLNRMQKWKSQRQAPVYFISEIQLPWKTVIRQNCEI